MGAMVEPDRANTLPEVAEINLGAPLRWLKGGWGDFWRAAGPCLAYGAVLALTSAAFFAGLALTGQVNWFMALAGGFFFVAPMLAMGLYEAGRLLEAGRTPKLSDMILVRTASTRDLAYLGLALALVYFFWGRMAQLIYALSTYQVHETPAEFFTFMVGDPDGRMMALIGAAIGGVIAFAAFCLVAVSAPMLLQRRTDVFIATITSVRAVAKNPAPMLLWAVLIAALTAAGIATACLGLVVVFPVIGLASWRAYRDLVPNAA